MANVFSLSEIDFSRRCGLDIGRPYQSSLGLPWNNRPELRSFCIGMAGDALSWNSRDSNRVLFLDGGKIVEENTPDEFFTKPKTERAKKFLNVFEFDTVR